MFRVFLVLIALVGTGAGMGQGPVSLSPIHQGKRDGRVFYEPQIELMMMMMMMMISRLA